MGHENICSIIVIVKYLYDFFLLINAVKRFCKCRNFKISLGLWLSEKHEALHKIPKKLAKSNITLGQKSIFEPIYQIYVQEFNIHSISFVGRFFSQLYFRQRLIFAWLHVTRGRRIFLHSCAGTATFCFR